MGAEAEVLEIVAPGALPPAPYVLVPRAWVTALRDIERQIAEHRITDANSAQIAAHLQVRLTNAGSSLEKARKALKDPFLKKCQEIDEIAKGPMVRIERGKSALKAALTAWDDAERARIAKIEAERQAELERLRKQKEAEERAEKEKADKLAKEASDLEEERRLNQELEDRQRAAAGKPPVRSLDFEDEVPPAPPPAPALTISETDQRIAELEHAPAQVVRAPQGVAMRTVLKHEVLDVSKLPDVFIIKTANDKAIRAACCDGWKEGSPIPVLAGVRFVVERQPVATRGRMI